MQIPTKQLNSGFKMPVYGLGTWRMGGDEQYDPNNDDEADIRAIQEAITLGVTHIDTAEIYADGYSETLVGKAIKDFDRQELLIASKVRTQNLSYDDILKSCERSLQRLQLDYIDLYLLHGYNASLPLKGSMRALDHLVDQRMVKQIGVCNFGVEHLREAQGLSQNKIVCDQVHYNLKFREPERTGLLQYCQDNDIFLVAWRPLGQGLRRGGLDKGYQTNLNEIADRYHKTPAQIALNWLISQKNVVTIAKTRSIEHLKENLGALDWALTAEDVEKLRAYYPHQEMVSDTIPLR